MGGKKKKAKKLQKERGRRREVASSHAGRVHSLIPNSVCSLYFSRSIWMLVLKKSSLALSCWAMEAMAFFILERQLLFRRRFILR